MLIVDSLDTPADYGYPEYRCRTQRLDGKSGLTIGLSLSYDRQAQCDCGN